MPGSRTQAAYDGLLQKLVSGELGPGERLVNRALAEELGVSVIPVREALRRLASEGLIEHIPGAGASVRRLERKELVKLYAFRELLETYAAREAAEHIEEHHIEQLDAACTASAELRDRIRGRRDGRATPTQISQWLKWDATFHRILIDAADNPWLMKASNELHLMSYVISSKPRHVTAESATQTHEEHVQIAEAVRDGDGARAADTMVRHIRSARALLSAHQDSPPSLIGP